MNQSQIAKEVKISTSTIQLYRREIDMISLYRIQASSNTRKQKTPNTNLDDVKMSSKDLKMISNDLKMTSKEFSPETVNPKKNKM